MRKEIFEVLVPERSRLDVVFAYQTVFSEVEEVVEEMLMPRRGVGGWKSAKPDSKDVHMQERYLSPGAEGWGKAKIYGTRQSGASSCM